MTERELCRLFDHTFLKAYARREDFEKLCAEARAIGAAMVAINSEPVRLCHELLKDSGVHVGAAIAFPLGQTNIEVKEFETIRAIEDGADEIDYVINIGKAKDHDYAYIEEEMERLVKICHERGKIIKVILEICYLDDEEIVRICEIAKKVRPDFVKTSTGFGSGGATAEAVRLMKECVGDDVKVKAAGGIRSWADCQKMIEAGAERIGTSSSLQILEEFRTQQKK